MTCLQNGCKDGEVPILRLVNTVDNIYKATAKNPLDPIGSQSDRAPCPTCQPEKRRAWEAAEAKKKDKGTRQ